MPKIVIKNLREMYVEQGMTCREIADIVGCSTQTVHNRITEQGIETRSLGPRLNNYASYRTQNGGYETWRESARTNGENTVLVHRLAAVAWFGLDAVKDNVVHHVNCNSWDNREENFELMTQGEHIAVHREDW